MLRRDERDQPLSASALLRKCRSAVHRALKAALMLFRDKQAELPSAARVSLYLLKP